MGTRPHSEDLATVLNSDPFFLSGQAGPGGVSELQAVLLPSSMCHPVLPGALAWAEMAGADGGSLGTAWRGLGHGRDLWLVGGLQGPEGGRLGWAVVFRVR